MTRAIAACLAAAAACAAAAGMGTAAARSAHHRARPATENTRCRIRHHHKRRCSRRHHRRHSSSHTGTQVGTGSVPSAGGTQGPPAPASSSGGGTTQPPKILAHLQVIEREFSVVPSRTTVAAGTVAVELDNRGQDPHNLRVERSDSTGVPFDFGLAQPGSVTSQKLNLGPGTWKLYCTLPGHDQAGMHALITVNG